MSSKTHTLQKCAFVDADKVRTSKLRV